MLLPRLQNAWPLIFSVFLFGCERTSETPVESVAAPVNTAPAKDAMQSCTRSLNIFVAPLQDEVSTATLKFSEAGTGELECADIQIGEKQVRLMPGESTTISAHPTELQRVYIRNQRFLVYIEPGSTIEFGGNPEHGWELRNDRFVQKDGVIPGQIYLNPPSAWTHPITVEGPPEEPVAFPSIVDPPLVLVPAPFPNVRVDTGDERVQLAIGSGEQWILEVNPEGGLTGSLR